MKPCPFCQSEDTSEEMYLDLAFPIYYVICNKCHARGPHDYSSENAYELWDDREDIEEYKEVIDNLEQTIQDMQLDGGRGDL